VFSILIIIIVINSPSERAINRIELIITYLTKRYIIEINGILIFAPTTFTLSNVCPVKNIVAKNRIIYTTHVYRYINIKEVIVTQIDSLRACVPAAHFY